MSLSSYRSTPKRSYNDDADELVRNVTLTYSGGNPWKYKHSFFYRSYPVAGCICHLPIWMRLRPKFLLVQYLR